MNLLALTSIPQRLMLGGLGAALLAACTYNVVQGIENKHLASANLKLDSRINDPKTGYVVRLTQAETNTATCTAAIGRQNVAIRKESAQFTASIAAVQARYDLEHAARIRAENAAAAFLAHTPTGVTLVDRVLDVDAQILGDLK